jgi:uncharacterized SAM-binding protein YcdF (DUF218 family)
MFILGKIFGTLIISPTFFIILFIFTGLFLNKDNFKKFKKINFIFGIVFYIITIRPTADIASRFIENIYAPATIEQIASGEAYVLLGGGISEKTPIGNIATENAGIRIMHVASLYNQNPKKIYITGGKVTNQEVSESSVYKDTLIKLNVPAEDIISEENSRTTEENAKYTSEILKKNNIRDIVLVTSAVHMTRSKMTFEKYGFNVIPAPCGYIGNQRNYNILDFIPRSHNLDYFMRSIWELIGIVFYKINGYI